MTDVAIRCEGLAKQYQIGERESYKAIRDVITNTLASPLRRLRSAVRHSSNGRAAIEKPNIWALKDVSFEIKRGEVVGIIGRNGAGKSTLLKILSRITEPTLGHADIWGRVGSLLEVGTGFHPELTGRDNIFLNGAILGMRRAEIARKFDEIVAFAEVEKFIDTPVKRYSSGMYMRLAFAVAAHMETEILAIDEVLAVGDSGFQRKCLGKMHQVTAAGRTVIFVSHNMGAILQICKRGILLENGKVKAMGTAVEMARAYYAEIGCSTEINARVFQGPLADRIEFERLSIGNGDREDVRVVWPRKPIHVSVVGTCSREVPNFRITLSVYREGVRLVTMHDVHTPQTLPVGRFRADYVIPALFLRPGEYSVAVGGYRDGMNEWIWGPDVTVFTIAEDWGEGYDPINIGFVNLPHYGTRMIDAPFLPEAPTRV
jgi:lipopolysaccharide transport system ATP-binding protein